MLQISKSQMKNLKNPHFTDYELEVQREYKAPKVTITVRAGMKIWVQAVWLHTSQTLSYTFKQNRAKIKKKTAQLIFINDSLSIKHIIVSTLLFFFFWNFRSFGQKKKKSRF